MATTRIPMVKWPWPYPHIPCDQQGYQVPHSSHVTKNHISAQDFRLILYDATGGAKFDPDTDGGEAGPL